MLESEVIVSNIFGILGKMKIREPKTYKLRYGGVLLAAVFVCALGLSSKGVRAETTTPITDEQAQTIVGTKLKESGMTPSVKLCLYYSGGDSLKDRLDKMFLVASSEPDGWSRISEDLSEWLVLGDNASSRPSGFLKIGMTNISDSEIQDFGGPGNNIPPGGTLDVSIPSSKLSVLKGCIMNYDSARIIKKALVDSGQDRQELDNQINEYRGGTGLEDTSSEDDAIDPTVQRPTGTASVSTAESKDSLSKIYSYLADAVSLLSIAMGAILVGSTIYAGIQYTTAGADSGKVSKAKARLASNVLVLAIFLVSATVLNWILPG